MMPNQKCGSRFTLVTLRGSRWRPIMHLRCVQLFIKDSFLTALVIIDVGFWCILHELGRTEVAEFSYPSRSMFSFYCHTLWPLLWYPMMLCLPPVWCEITLIRITELLCLQPIGRQRLCLSLLLTFSPLYSPAEHDLSREKQIWSQKCSNGFFISSKWQ